MASIRSAAVAGSFYPDNAQELTAMVDGFLSRATTPPQGPSPKAIIAPHAGYIYSGQLAGEAYARILPIAKTIRRVVLLGPCHRVPVRGLALSSADTFTTPLGRVPLDKDAMERIADMDQVSVFDDTHAQEHSLEVHLPFLQTILEDFTLIPIVVGQASPDEVADVLERLWGGNETLIVVSTDLSHYLDYDAARRMDAATCKTIENLDPYGFQQDQACGRIPVSGLLAEAKRRGLSVTTLGLKNSGDTAGPSDRVVGYGAWMFTPCDDFADQTKSLLSAHGDVLLDLAARSIKHGLAEGRALPVNSDTFNPELRENGASFVTLKQNGRLRGCIGSPQAYQALCLDVAENAFSAAFKDKRFSALTEKEVSGLELSISVLSTHSAMTFTGEADLISQLRPYKDGLVIEDRKHRALFLPSVWEGLSDPKAFLLNLKTKAGMKPDHWSDGFKAWRFIAEEVSSKDLIDPAALWTS
jgi:MEMO1 family protein